MSLSGRAGLNKKPCISVQFRSRRVALCTSVSTPSAVVVMLRSEAMSTTAWTIEDPPFSESPLTNDLSILILSNGNHCQSAFDWDPLSASKRDPFERRALLVALGSSELVGVAETARARVV
jgi:hypothetical protein